VLCLFLLSKPSRRNWCRPQNPIATASVVEPGGGQRDDDEPSPRPTEEQQKGCRMTDGRGGADWGQMIRLIMADGEAYRFPNQITTGRQTSLFIPNPKTRSKECLHSSLFHRLPSTTLHVCIGNDGAKIK
jgi:hypothetical protein